MCLSWGIRHYSCCSPDWVLSQDSRPVGWLVHHIASGLSISTIVGWIALQIPSHIYAPFRMNYDNFGQSLRAQCVGFSGILLCADGNKLSTTQFSLPCSGLLKQEKVLSWASVWFFCSLLLHELWRAGRDQQKEVSGLVPWCTWMITCPRSRYWTGWTDLAIVAGYSSLSCGAIFIFHLVNQHIVYLTVTSYISFGCSSFHS